MRGLLTAIFVAAVATGLVALALNWEQLSAPARQQPAPPTESRPDRAQPADDEDKPDEVPGKPLPRIALPEPLEGLEFGTPSRIVARRFPPAWTREARGGATLVHYFDESKSLEARFHCTDDAGLQRIELRIKPSSPSEIGDLYEQMRRRYERLYGELPGSRRNRWSDGKTAIWVSKTKDYVALQLAPSK